VDTSYHHAASESLTFGHSHDPEKAALGGGILWVDGQQVWGRWVERALFDEYHTGPQWRYRCVSPNNRRAPQGLEGRA